MRKEIVSLMNFALDNHIGFNFNDKLKPETPPEAFTEDRYIVLNMNTPNKNELPFQFAHEIGHILNGDRSIEALQFNAKIFSPIEYRAHKTAIELLLPFYMTEAIEPNYLEFMDMYVIPERMTDAVVTSMEYYGVE